MQVGLCPKKENVPFQKDDPIWASNLNKVSSQTKKRTPLVKTHEPLYGPSYFDGKKHHPFSLYYAPPFIILNRANTQLS